MKKVTLNFYYETRINNIPGVNNNSLLWRVVVVGLYGANITYIRSFLQKNPAPSPAAYGFAFRVRSSPVVSLSTLPVAWPFEDPDPHNSRVFS